MGRQRRSSSDKTSSELLTPEHGLFGRYFPNYDASWNMRRFEYLRKVKNSIPPLRIAWAWMRRVIGACLGDRSYAGRLATENAIFTKAENIQDLPPIFHYWAHTYVRPMLEERGCSNPEQFFARYLMESAARTHALSPNFLSIGAGNCDREVRVAQYLREGGLTDFTIDCLELNVDMLVRGGVFATSEGVAEHIRPVRGDFNVWKSSTTYDGIMASQSLHHVVNLEGLFTQVQAALGADAYFVIDDMVGRNGHQRWPEALTEVRKLWRELPKAYRHNHQLDRYESTYRNWDCSTEGFEGIRAQDILPLLLERFHFHAFIGYGNVVDVFLDRAFGPNFDATARWDREFIDRIQALDEELLGNGTLTSTHMLAVVAASPCAEPFFSRAISPEMSVRRPRSIFGTRRASTTIASPATALREH